MFKPFFVHYNPYMPEKMTSKHPRGFTAYIEGNKKDTSNVDIRITYCNPKDQFCKAIGRSVSKLSDTVFTVSKRALVPFIAEGAVIVNGGCESDIKEEIRNWNYLYKYLL